MAAPFAYAREAHNYYRTPRAMCPTAENKLLVRSFPEVLSYDALRFADKFLTQLLLLIVGEQSDTAYQAESILECAASAKKELVRIEGATHVSLYDKDANKTVEKLAVFFKNVFTVFVAGLPRKPKRPFADWYSTYARSFSKAAYSFPTRKNCAQLPIASAIPQNGAIRFVWQSLPPPPSTPVPTKQMPYPCNHRQQGLFVPPQDYPCHVPRLAGSLFYP